MSGPVGISRRRVLTGIPLLPLGASVTASTASARSKRRTFVLVHGGWHGGWCWKELTPRLTTAGHRVYTPTLTGLGERSHLLTPDIGLETHIEDINALLFYEDLHDVVLVGHSYGGMVIAGVSPRVVARLARVIYLDAFLPEDGKALEDYVDRAPTAEGIWRLPPPGSAPRWGVTNDADVAWMEARLGDQPVKTFKERVRIDADISLRVPHTYIQCTKLPLLMEAAGRARRRGFRYRELFSAGHDA
jgi:pimeloyl-ACP methyl ester carboxylesterase